MIFNKAIKEVIFPICNVNKPPKWGLNFSM